MNPQSLRFFKKSTWLSIFIFFTNPCVYAINLSGILLVTNGSFCLKDPEAAFLGFANFSLIFSKSLFSIKTSPLISISSGKFFSSIKVGISLIVFKLCVISSPSLPSPLERPLKNLPFM